MRQTGERKYLTLHEAEAKLKLSKSGLWRLRKDPRFPKPIKIGRRRLLPDDELDAYVESTREAAA